MSNNLLNNLFETRDDSDDDDNEDIDYNPDKEVVDRSDDSCSDGDVEEDGEGRHKRKSLKHRKSADIDEEQEPPVKEVETEEALKQKADTLWDQFCSELPKSDDKNKDLNSELKGESTSTAGSAKQTVTKVYDFAGQEVKVTEEVETKSVTKSMKTNDTSVVNSIKGNEVPVKGVKRSGGLGSLLDQLKKPKITTLTKSFMDWNNFKKNEGIEDELNLHNKSKDTYIEKQAFLQRADLRQFENEKQIRDKNRSQRQLSKD